MIGHSKQTLIGKIFKRKGRLPLLIVGTGKNGTYKAKQLCYDSMCREFLEKNLVTGKLLAGEQITLRDKRILDISKVHPGGSFQLVFPEVTEHSAQELEEMAAEKHLGYGGIGIDTIGSPNLNRKGSSFAWRKQGTRRVLRK
jgi:hypothetical protein